MLRWIPPRDEVVAVHIQVRSRRVLRNSWARASKLSVFELGTKSHHGTVHVRRMLATARACLSGPGDLGQAPPASMESMESMLGAALPQWHGAIAVFLLLCAGLPIVPFIVSVLAY